MKTELILAVMLTLVSSLANAKSVPETSEWPFAQKELTKEEKFAKETKETYDKVKAAEKKEEMRDKTHDNRVKIGKNSSLGADSKGVNIRVSIP